MDKPDLNVHKLDAKAEPSRAPERREEPLRYVIAQDYPSAVYQDEDSIDLLALWRVLVQYKHVVAGIFLLGTVLAIAVAFLSTPIYRAELVMATAAEEKGGGLSSLAGQFGGLASLAGVSLPAGDNDVDRVLATLKSRAFLVPFLKQEKIVALLSQESTAASPNNLAAYETFVDDMLDIRKDNKTGLITLAVEWKEPVQAARWANTLVLRLNEHQRQNAINEAQQSIDYLNQQLTATGVVDMQQAIYRLIESQTKVIMLANVKQQYAMQIIDPAQAPEKPVRPQPLLIVVLGAVLSIFVAVFVIFLLHGLKGFRQRLAQNA